MASRRDLFQSYQFMVQRVVSGLVLRETDPAQTPLRRMGSSMFGGVMVAVIALAITGIIGLISPGGNTSWQTAGQVIVEEETGARFVWLEDKNGDSYLHPVPNLATGVLLTGKTEVLSVSSASLVDAPRGQELGLANGPDSLPSPERMLGAPWTLCSLPAETRSGEETPNTALVVGRPRSQGVPIDSSAIVVRDIERNTLHLVWQGRQFPIASEQSVLEAMALGSEPQIKVGTAWLNALPAGETLSPITVKGRGGKSSAVAKGVVGQVRYVESGGNRQYYLVLAAKIQAITELQAQITLADPTVKKTAYKGQTPQATPVPPAEITASNRIDLPPPDPNDAPEAAPQAAAVNSDGSTVCASFDNAGPVPEVAVEARVEGAEVAPATALRLEAGTVLADRVLVQGGYGTIVESMTSPTAASGSLYLVTDEGTKYAVPSADILGMFGYDGTAPVRMPAALVARIPTGDALDPEQAKLPLS